MPGNERKFSDFDDVRKEEDFDRLPEKRTKSDQLKGKCYSRYGFSAFSERTNDNTTNLTFGVLKPAKRVLVGLAAKRAKNSAVWRKPWKILNVCRRKC